MRTENLQKFKFSLSVNYPSHISAVSTIKKDKLKDVIKNRIWSDN